MTVSIEQLRREARRKLEKAQALESGGLSSLMLYLPSELKERLRRAAETSGDTMREVVIAALEKHLA